MWISKTIREANQRRAVLKGHVGLVPTMGALHDGHLLHIQRCRALADHVLVSIFVNPTQFGPQEDFDSYPRPIKDDLATCASAGVDGVFWPNTHQMYPPQRIAINFNIPILATILEGQFRPTYFAGVCHVVCKLFNILKPHIATFGCKDYQQLKIIEALVANLAMPVQIVPIKTVRDPDGLALSSRNAYLDAAARCRALGLSKALHHAQTLIEREGQTEPTVVERAMSDILLAHQMVIDYAVVRHPRTLGKLDVINPAKPGGVVALAAGRVGHVRLIDNLLIAANRSPMPISTRPLA